MTVTGIKFVCLLKDGSINTWHDVFEESVEDIIRKVRHSKGWIGGKFLEIYLEFVHNGKYYKTYLNIQDSPFNLLLGS